jgi:hypothetical protein
MDKVEIERCAQEIDAKLAELNALVVPWSEAQNRAPVEVGRVLRKAAWFSAPLFCGLVEAPHCPMEKRRPLSAAARVEHLKEWLTTVGPVSGFHELLDRYRSTVADVPRAVFIDLLKLIGVRVIGDRIELPPEDFLA